MQESLLTPAAKPPERYVRILRSTLALMPAIFVGRIGWVGMKVTDTALLGHVSSHALTASALSDLWTSATGVLMQGRVLGIFVGNAIGAGQPEVAGSWLHVALVVQGIIALPVMGLWAATQPVLMLFHEERSLVRDAAYFSLVLMGAIPARVLFSTLSQFLAAQKVVRPLMLAALLGLALNLALGVALVLGVPFARFDGYGFHACPIVTTAVEYWQLGVLILWMSCMKLSVNVWPATDDAQGQPLRSVARARVWQYLKMYVPAALSTASDFWRMSLVGTFAATLSSLDLAVFTASYRVLWIGLTLAGSLASAVGIQLAEL